MQQQNTCLGHNEVSYNLNLCTYTKAGINNSISEYFKKQN